MMMTCFEQDPQEFGLGEIFSNFKKRLMRGRKKEPFHLLTFMQKDIMQNMRAALLTHLKRCRIFRGHYSISVFHFQSEF